MRSEDFALHLVLWLHQYADVWQPGVLELVLLGSGWVMGWQIRTWMHDWHARTHARPGLKAWLREWGAPGGLLLVGMLLLLSPGWAWLDNHLLRSEQHQASAGQASSQVIYRGPVGVGQGVPGTLCQKVNGEHICR
jgi:hypothetical protein